MKAIDQSKKYFFLDNKSKSFDQERSSSQKDYKAINKFFPENNFKVLQTKTFNLQESIISGKRTYLKKFDTERTSYVATEVLVLNPHFKERDLFWSGLAIWYLDDEEVGRNNFSIEVKKNWEIVEIVQSWGTPLTGFWKPGECKIELYFENKLACTHHFIIGNSEEVDFQVNSKFAGESLSQEFINEKQSPIISATNKNDSLDSIFEELNNFVGLKKLKNSLSDFITYLNFAQERKKHGLITEENITAHCLFLGNPGTGKTTVARLLGRFFKSIGLLEHGHVIEVDRSTLVGEFIGETAQKTEKVIAQALGGILFIDEAYSLKPEKSGKDFGQEAIDIILKRMEDYKGQFFVIAAGYPLLMQNFIESNPGLKSRFTHLFNFDDYTAVELSEIYKSFAVRENFIINKDAEELLVERLELLLEKTDETFGNARFIRNLLNDTKIQLSKRYKTLSEEDKNYSSLSTIKRDDILFAFTNYSQSKSGFTHNNDKIEKYINEFNDLVAIENVKYTFNKLLAAIKVDQLKKDKLIASTPKNLNSIFICEQGSGTSTVARLFAKIFKELSLLENGQVIEIDSSLFYGLSKIDSYLMIDKIFQEAKGNIILVNDSVLTLQARNDFSDSLLQYFLKKLYLCKDNVTAILSGNREDLEELFTNVPVIENQFPNIYDFGHYSNRQLLEITLNICQKKNYQLDEGAWQQMLEILAELRKEKLKNFYNTRTIKEILNKAISKQEERIIKIKNPSDSDLMTIKLEDFSGMLSSGN